MLASVHHMDDPSFAAEVPLAVIGIVPCKVTTEGGPINIGDLLVSSSSPGRAMKGTHRDRMLGAVVGKALEPLSEGAGVIQVRDHTAIAAVESIGRDAGFVRGLPPAAPTTVSGESQRRTV
jgi:hypothetical protein